MVTQLYKKIINLFLDLKDEIEYHGVLKGLYYSDLFLPIYKLIHMPKEILNYLQKFLYYGYYGTKTYTFDANSVDILIYAHIKKVRRFMDSDNTHLVWNSCKKTGLIRKLYELEELCKRKIKNDFSSWHYSNIVREKYPDREKLFNNPVAKKALSKAIKKDQRVQESLKARYNHLFNHYLPYFWD